MQHVSMTSALCAFLWCSKGAEAKLPVLGCDVLALISLRMAFDTLRWRADPSTKVLTKGGINAWCHALSTASDDADLGTDGRNSLCMRRLQRRCCWIARLQCKSH